MQHEAEEFVKFCKEKVSVFFIAVVIILSYGLLISRGAVGIDNESTEYYLMGGLIAQDRVGWNLTNKIFQSYNFLPWWTSLIGIIFFASGMLFWIYGLDKKLETGFSKITITMAVSIAITYPYIAKFAIFNGNMAAIGYVICFTALALNAAYDLFDEVKLKYFIFIILGLCIVFLFEKAYITFFFQGATAFLLLKKKEKATISLSKMVKWFSLLCMAAMISFFAAKGVILAIQIYTEIPASGYTSNYIIYDISDITGFLNSFHNFLMNYKTMVINRAGIYLGEKVYVAAVCVMLSATIIMTFKRHDIFIFLLGIASIILSCSVYLATGNIYMPIRSFCFNYVFFIEICILYLVYDFEIVNRISMIVFMAGILLVGSQSREMEEIYDKQFQSYQKDKEMSEIILSDIQKECGMSAAYHKPVVFMGFPNDKNLNYGEVEESSVYIWDRNANVYNEQTSVRIFRFYEKIGHSLAQPESDTDFFQIREEIADMRGYPEEGYIRELEECIIVKLGDSLCEILSLKDCKIDDNEKLFGNIENFNYENRCINITGWLLEKNRNSYANDLSLVLLNKKNQYRLRMDHLDRSDVTDYMHDGLNYNNSGYHAEILLPEYVYPGSYRVYIQLQNKTGAYLYDTVQDIIVE